MRIGNPDHLNGEATSDDGSVFPASMSWLREAATHTAQTIKIRAVRYRNLVLAVIAVGLLSVIGAVIFSWRALLGVLLIIPFCSAFMFFDGLLISRWQRRILEMWIQGDMNFSIFSQGMTAMQMLPQRTVQDMLGILPDKDAFSADHNISPDVRKAIAMTLRAIGKCYSDWLGFLTLGCIVGLAFLSVAVIQWYWLPLPGILLVFPISALSWPAGLLRLRHWRREVLKLRQQNIPIDSFMELARKLNWRSIPDSRKEKLLNSMISAGQPDEHEKSVSF